MFFFENSKSFFTWNIPLTWDEKIKRSLLWLKNKGFWARGVDIKKHEYVNSVADEFVIGDLWGESSNKDISNFISDFLKKEGFNVSKNVPYAGAYTLKQYGNFKSGVNAIQLEIRKDLYLDEKKLTLKKDFSELKLTMKNLVKNLNNLLIDLNN